MPLPPVAVAPRGALAVEAAVQVKALKDELDGGGLEFGAGVVGDESYCIGETFYL